MPAPQQAPYPLRMPKELRDRLEERATANGRSINAEIIAILQNAVDSPSGPPDMDSFAEQIADKVAKRLKAK